MYKLQRYIIVLSLLIISTTSVCANSPFNLYSQWVSDTYNSMTIEERVAQMFVVPAYSNQSQASVEKVADLIRNQKVGGVIFFQGGPIREAIITNYFQSIAKTPLLIGIDGEWGLSMRLDSVANFPRQMMLGAIQEDSILYEMGLQMAEEFKAIGINLNFAPSVDVNNNPNNPVINSRSFGENPIKVAEHSTALAKGMSDGGILLTAKHFPGHGDTNTDSHLATPIIKHDKARLDSVELYPFKQIINQGISGIMVGHLNVPALDKKGRSASLSPDIITGILQEQYQFEGIICTDALNMKGVSSNPSPGAIELEAFQAGVNMILMSVNPITAIKKISDAIKNGQIDEAMLEKACRTILAAKEKVGLNQRPKPIDIKTIKQQLDNDKSLSIRHKLSENAITLVQNQDEILPLIRLDSTKTALLLIGVDNQTSFSKRIAYYDQVDVYCSPKNNPNMGSLIEKLSKYDRVIIGIQNTGLYPPLYGIANSVFTQSQKIAETTDVILTIFGSPYNLNRITNSQAYKAIIIAYEDGDINGDYAAQLIYGGIEAKGKLPVSAGGFKEGEGIYTPQTRLGYTLPINLGIDPKVVNKVDSVVNMGIKQKAYPGCQVLAAVNGKVFIMKNYGYTDYNNQQQVTDTTIYDLASVTKISATTPLMMMLYDQKKIDLNQKLSTYLPELSTSNKKSITIKAIMAHQARLPAAISYYPSIMEPAKPGQQLFTSRLSSQNNILVDTRYYGNKDTKFKFGIINKQVTATKQFPNQVAEGIYSSQACIDTLLQKMDNAPLNRYTRYLYSDVGFIYLWRAIERITNSEMENLADRLIYSPLGANTLGYYPLSKFPKSQIAPTENDMFFRKQLVQGTVHDQTAAILGGVSGHAGLFSNANDLAKLMQVYLNKGSYGGVKYIDSSTVELFTSCQYCTVNRNRRGLGFDKPSYDNTPDSTCDDCTSADSYGHTGFSGTYTWSDPETGLLYIFLCNRINPTATNKRISSLNIRTSILEVLTSYL